MGYRWDMLDESPARRKPCQERCNTASEADTSLWSFLWLSGHRYLNRSTRRAISIDRRRFSGCPNEFWQNRAEPIRFIEQALSFRSGQCCRLPHEGADVLGKSLRYSNRNASGHRLLDAWGIPGSTVASCIADPSSWPPRSTQLARVGINKG